MLTEIKNRGTKDVCIVVCDGLTGLPDAVSSVWSQAIVQTCVIHLLSNSFRYASRKDWPAIAKDLKSIYTAATEAAALDRFAEFAGRWEARYPAIVALWENAWAEFVPFLGFDPEIRTVIYTTNAIESINARIRKAVKARGHFPTEQAAHEVRVPGGDESRPDREGPPALVESVEAGVECLYNCLPESYNSSSEVTEKSHQS